MARVRDTPIRGIAAKTGILTFSGEDANRQNLGDSLILDPTTSSPLIPAIRYDSRYNFSNDWLRLKYLNVSFVQQMTRKFYRRNRDDTAFYLKYDSSYSISHTFKFPFLGNDNRGWYLDAVNASVATISPAPLGLKGITYNNFGFYEKSLNSPQPNVGVWSAKIYNEDGTTSYDANGNVVASVYGGNQRVRALYSGDYWYISLQDNFPIALGVSGRDSGLFADPIDGAIFNANSSERNAFTAPSNGTPLNCFYGTNPPPDDVITSRTEDIYTYSGSYTASLEFWQ